MNVAGFLRLTPITPAPVIPIFQDHVGSEFCVQSLNNNGKVEDFSPLPLAFAHRLILNEQTSSSYPAINPGDAPLYAFEMENKTVAVRQGEDYRSFLSQLASSTWGIQNSFILLDIGKYLDDKIIISSAARSCVRSLAKISTKIVESWVRSSIDDLDLARELLSIAENETHEVTQLLRINFVCNEYMLRSMDEFSRVKGMSRAAAIRAAFSPHDFSEKRLLAVVPGVTASLLGIFSQSTQAEQILMTFYQTKGAVRVDKNTFELFNTSRDILRKFFARETNFKKIMKLGITNTGLGTFGSLTLLCGLAALDEDLMNKLLSFSVKDVVGRSVYESMTRAHSAAKRPT